MTTNFDMIGRDEIDDLEAILSISNSDVDEIVHTVKAESDESIELAVHACAKGYLVLADAFFPGWVAHVGERPVPIHRADYLLRAVELEAGDSVVRFEYRPNWPR